MRTSPRPTGTCADTSGPPRSGAAAFSRSVRFATSSCCTAAGVGGGSLGYANVLMEPEEAAFETAAWRDPVDWQRLLPPPLCDRAPDAGGHRESTPGPGGCRAAGNRRSSWAGRDASGPPRWGSSSALRGRRAARYPIPISAGQGPPRRGCIHCGGCMVGCRHNAKNTLVKNYLYFAEKLGAEVRADSEVRDIRPLARRRAGRGALRGDLPSSRKGWRPRQTRRLRARNVIFAAGTLGTLRLLFRCRDVTRSLPAISPRLGEVVRTNSEALLGSVSRIGTSTTPSGIAVTSIFQADPVTTIEPVRYPAGSSAMRFLGGPMIDSGNLASPPASSRWPIPSGGPEISCAPTCCRGGPSARPSSW